MTNSGPIPNWAATMLEQIRDGDYARIELIIRNGCPKPAPKNMFKKIIDNFNRILFLIFVWLEDRRYRPEPSAFSPRELTELLPDTLSIEVTPIQKTYSDYFSLEDVEIIKGHHIDVFIRLGFRILRLRRHIWQPSALHRLAIGRDDLDI